MFLVHQIKSEQVCEEQSSLKNVEVPTNRLLLAETQGLLFISCHPAKVKVIHSNNMRVTHLSSHVALKW